MRDFIGVKPDLMISEIERDLSKAPKVKSERVQNVDKEGNAREALNYHYVVNASDWLEYTPLHLFAIMSKYSKFYEQPENSVKTESWFNAERVHRLTYPEVDAPIMHPILGNYLEGNEYSYSYGERLTHLFDPAVAILADQPTSRRVYLPVYQPGDLLRAGIMTRVPCSLGYSLILRENQGKKFLHMTYLQRSCDFDVFWITDLMLAMDLMQSVQAGLDFYEVNVELGRLDHMIISFHQFFDASKEIY